MMVTGRSKLAWASHLSVAEVEMQGYCMKCKTQREMRSPKQVTMKNGRPATEGTCPQCGTKMFKIGAAK